MKMKMVLALVQTLVATSHEYGKCSWLYPCIWQLNQISPQLKVEVAIIIGVEK